MEKKRSYSSGTEKALFMLSRGRCYVPECPAKVIRNVETGPEVNVEIAHIVAHEDGGPRSDPKMSEKERRSFSNLILLCGPHHKMIDRKGSEKIFTVEVLRKWKVDREGDYAAELEGLDNLTQEKLEYLLTDAVGDAKEELLVAIERVEDVSHEAAQTLRVLVAEVFDRPYLDVDAIALLNESAHMLRNLNESASMLNDASWRLRNLQESAATLVDVARRLDNLQDSAEMLSMAAGRLRGLEENSGHLRLAASEIQGAIESVPSYRELDSIVDKLRIFAGTFDRAVDSADSALRDVIVEMASAREITPQVVHAVSRRSDLFWKGVAVGFVLTLLLVALVVWQMNRS